MPGISSIDQPISNPKISVIIPMYNSEDYIEECVRNLMEQTMDDLELIFIDDASTDSTLRILETSLASYAYTNKKVVILRNDYNLGVAYSRELGMRKAQGEWVIHCDSDDYVEKDIYSKMLKNAEKKDADMVVCSFDIFGNRLKGIKKIQGDGKITAEELLGGIFGREKKEYHGSLCNKLIKKDYLKDISLPKGLSYCEDSLTLLQMAHKCKNIIVMPDVLYHYRYRKGSLVRSSHRVMERQVQTLVSYLKENESTFDSQTQEALKSLIVSVLHRAAQGNRNIKNFSKNYISYLPYLNLNKRLNYFEKLFLRQSLKGNALRAYILGSLNREGKKGIKKIIYTFHKNKGRKLKWCMVF